VDYANEKEKEDIMKIKVMAANKKRNKFYLTEGFIGLHQRQLRFHKNVLGATGSWVLSQSVSRADVSRLFRERSFEVTILSGVSITFHSQLDGITRPPLPHTSWAGLTEVRIGCAYFTGKNFKKIEKWAALAKYVPAAPGIGTTNGNQ
jgi:hypothetical protein